MKLHCEWITSLPSFRLHLTPLLHYSAGLPQIILAQWFDLYDMADRIEYSGIGIYGNKEVAPDIEAKEFGSAISRLVRRGEESKGFRTRAKAVGEACRKAGGKRTAVDKLLEIAEGR